MSTADQKAVCSLTMSPVSEQRLEMRKRENAARLLEAQEFLDTTLERKGDVSLAGADAEAFVASLASGVILVEGTGAKSRASRQSSAGGHARRSVLAHL